MSLFQDFVNTLTQGKTPVVGGIVGKSLKNLASQPSLIQKAQNVVNNPQPLGNNAPINPKATQAISDFSNSMNFGGEMEQPAGEFSQGLANEAKPPAQSLPTQLANNINPNIKKVTSANPDELGASFKNAQIQDTYKRWNAYNPQTQDQAAKDIYDKYINPQMKANPKVVTIDEATNQIVSEMQKLVPGIDEREAKNTASNVINTMYRQGVKDPSAIVPKAIPTSALLDIKTGLNNTLPVKNYFNGIPPQSMNDLASVAGRNGLQNIIEQEHPDIAQLVRDYGNLREGAPSMFKASQQNGMGLGNLDLTKPATWLNPVVKTIPNIAEAGLRGDKKVLLPLAAGAGAGISALGFSGEGKKLADEITGQGKSQASDQNGGQPDSKNNVQGGQVDAHGNIISQPYSNINPDPSTGKFELPQAPTTGTNQRHYMTEAEHQAGLAKLADSETGSPYYNTHKATLDSQFQTDQEQAKTLVSNPAVADFMNNAKKYNADGKNLQDSLDSAGLGFWNGVANAKSIRAYNDPNFQGVKQDIMAFNDEFAATYKSVTGKDPGGDLQLDTANSIKQAQTKYKSMMQWISGTYGNYLNPWLALTSGSGSQTQSGTPETAISPVSDLPPTQSSLSPTMLQSNNYPSLPSSPPTFPH